MLLFQLESVVDRGTRIRPDDVVRTKQALSELDHYPIPSHGITDFTDDEMFEGIAAFQREHRLEVDSMMIPDGRTARAINAALTKLDEQNSVQPAIVDRQPPFTLGLFRTKGQTAHDRGHFSLASGNLNDALRQQPSPATQRVFGHVGKTVGGTAENAAKAVDDSVIAPSAEALGRAGRFIGRLFSSGPKYELPDALEWSEHEKYSHTLIPNTDADIRTDGPLRLKPFPGALGTERVRYFIQWFAVDEAGNIVGERSARKQFAIAARNYGFKQSPEEVIFKPPFVSKHGYVVRIEHPPQAPTHANSAGLYQNISGSRFKPDYKRSARGRIRRAKLSTTFADREFNA